MRQLTVDDDGAVVGLCLEMLALSPTSTAYFTW